MADAEPDRSLELEIEDEEPLSDAGLSGPTGSLDAPYGYGTDGKPLAPYGYKKDGVTPQRKRGRPAGSGKGGSSSPSRARSTSTRSSLRDQIGGLLFTVNMPLSMFLPRDALDTVEILALAKAIDDECQRNARFKKFVEQALAVQGGTSLVLVVAAIAGRRVVRHNIIEMPEPISNEGIDVALGAFIGITAGQQPNVDLASMFSQQTTSSET